MPDFSPAETVDLSPLFAAAVDGLFGLRLAFLDKERARIAQQRLEPSYVLLGPRKSIHLNYLVHADEEDRLRALVTELQAGDDDGAYVEFEVLAPHAEYSLHDDDAAHLASGYTFDTVTVDEIEAAFPDGLGMDADHDTGPVISIEDAHARGVKFYDADVTGVLVPGVLEHPFVGSVLAHHKGIEAKNVTADIRKLYLYVAKHPESSMKEGIGFTACQLGKDKETGKPRRMKRDVETNGAFLFDFDGGQTTDEILGGFESLGVTFAAYSSYNHLRTADVHKLRVVLPFAEPFVPDQYGDRENRAAAVWRASFESFCEKHKLNPDGNAKDMTRFMNGPRHPKGGTFFSRIHLGPLYQMEVVQPEERPIAKIAKARGVTLSYDTAGEAYVADGSGVEFFLSLIGDGDGMLGFHDPIYRVLCSYFSEWNEGPDAGPILRRIRDTIQKATKGPGRAQSDIDRYMSESYLVPEAQNAQKFIRDRRESQEKAEQEDVEYFDALVADYRAAPDPKKLEVICQDLAEIGRDALTTYVREKLAVTIKGEAKVGKGDFSAVMKRFTKAAEKKSAEALKRNLRRAGERPVIILDSTGYEFQCSTVSAGIDARNHASPFFFVTDRVQKRLAFDNGAPIMEPLDRMKFEYECNTSVVVYPSAEHAKRGLDTNLPDPVIKNLYGAPDSYGLPLLRLLRHPVHSVDGNLATESGYDPATTNYFDLRGGKIGHIPVEPSERMVRWAVKVYTDHLLVDFPFSDVFSTAQFDENGNRVEDTGAGSLANCLAMFLDPFVSGLVDGPTPIYTLDKPTRGTGATKLANLAHIIANGELVQPTVLPDDEREVRLTLMGMLMAAVADAFFDNVEDKFEYAAMLAYATGDGLGGRVLGEPRFVTLYRRNRTILTGNNLSPGEQMTRRLVAIYLNARDDQPEMRKGFKYPDIVKMVRDRRRIFIRAALVIVQNWFAKEMPEADVEFGGFERYAKTMGGILEAAGVTGFMANREAFYEAKRGEEADVTEFVQALYDSQSDKEKTTSFGKTAAWSVAYQNGTLQYPALKLGDVFGEEAQKGAIALCIGNRLLGTYKLSRPGKKPGIAETFSVELVKGKRQSDGARWMFIEIPASDSDKGGV